MNRNNAIITVNALEKSYKNVTVLKKIELNIQKGSIFALLGQNGAGKTTIVNILSTLIKPSRGTASICGYDIVKEGHEVRKHISLTGQYAAVDGLLTGRENLKMIGALRHLTNVGQKTDELLRAFHLTNAANRKVAAYSGGMRRRLDLAMSIIGAPAIIFLDEPTTGLDPQSRLDLWRVVKDMAHSGITVLLTTQYLEEAEQLADHIAVLHDGVIIAEGSPEDLKKGVPQGMVTLTFGTDEDLKKTKELLRSYHLTENKELLAVTVKTDGSVKQLTDILHLLECAGISLSGFTQKLPTLEDVFLMLTGKKEMEAPQ